MLLADRVHRAGPQSRPHPRRFSSPACSSRASATSAEFLLYVDYIYKLMTAARTRGRTARACRRPAQSRAYQMLPHARPGGIGGLARTAQRSRRQRRSLPRRRRSAHGSGRPAAHRRSGHAARFREARQGRRRDHARGQSRLPKADIATRKVLFRDAALAHVPLLQQINSALASKSDHSMPLEFFRDILDEHFAQR